MAQSFMTFYISVWRVYKGTSFKSNSLYPQNEEKYSFDEKNPFVQGGDETDVASVGYR